jgi:hypothetical protein
MNAIPKYTRIEIIKLIHHEILNNTVTLKLSEYERQKLLSNSAIWTPKEYELASEITGIELEELVTNLPEEDLSNVSFRALENNTEINEKVQQLNSIFEDLTYQLKIGSDMDERKI